MDVYTQLFAYRGIERLLIVLGGFLFAYLGYRLFLFGVDKGTGKLTSKSAFFKVTFSGSGPGLFFMAFGALILINSMFSSVELDREAVAELAANRVPSNSAEVSTVVKETVKFSNTSSNICDKIRLADHDNKTDDVLWVYNNLSDKERSPLLDQLVQTIQTQNLNQQSLLTVLRVMEESICEME